MFSEAEKHSNRKDKDSKLLWPRTVHLPWAQHKGIPQLDTQYQEGIYIQVTFEGTWIAGSAPLNAAWLQTCCFLLVHVPSQTLVFMHSRLGCPMSQAPHFAIAPWLCSSGHSRTSRLSMETRHGRGPDTHRRTVVGSAGLGHGQHYWPWWRDTAKQTGVVCSSSAPPAPPTRGHASILKYFYWDKGRWMSRTNRNTWAEQRGLQEMWPQVLHRFWGQKGWRPFSPASYRIQTIKCPVTCIIAVSCGHAIPETISYD